MFVHILIYIYIYIHIHIFSYICIFQIIILYISEIGVVLPRSKTRSAWVAQRDCDPAALARTASLETALNRLKLLASKNNRTCTASLSSKEAAEPATTVTSSRARASGIAPGTPGQRETGGRNILCSGANLSQRSLRLCVDTLKQYSDK